MRRTNGTPKMAGLRRKVRFIVEGRHGFDANKGICAGLRDVGRDRVTKCHFVFFFILIVPDQKLTTERSDIANRDRNHVSSQSTFPSEWPLVKACGLHVVHRGLPISFACATWAIESSEQADGLAHR